MSKISAAQKYIWLDQAINEGSARYNIGGYVTISGNLHIDHFRKAVSAFIRSQEVFSFSFEEMDGIPVCIKNEQKAAFELLDFSGKDREFAGNWITHDFQKPFSLNEFPLYRFVLIKLAADVYIWYAKIHHILADGGSFRLIFNEVSRLYQVLEKEEELQLEYREFSLAIDQDEQYRQAPAFELDRQYWVEKFKSLPSFIFSAGTSGDVIPNTLELVIDNRRGEKLRAFAKENNVSLFVLFTGIVAVHAARCYRNYDLSIGFPVMNREPRFRNTIGLFMNILAMRLQVEGDMSFAAFLKQVKRESISCLRHQRFQQADLLSYCTSKPAFKRFYDMRVSYEEFRFNTGDGMFGAEIKPISNKTEEDPVSIHIMDYVGGEIAIRFDFNTAFVKEVEAVGLVNAFEWLIDHLPGKADCRLSDLQLISPEAETVLYNFSNGPVVTRAEDSCFIKRWNEIVAAKPLATAISFKGDHFSYAAIDNKATTLSSALLNNDVKKNDRVGIFLDRSEKMIIAMLAIMKCNATIVALDKDYPAKRLQFILDDSQCKCCISDDEQADLLHNRTVIPITAANADDPGKSGNEQLPSASDAAYIIYTSGSTGKPKGVVISHASMYDYVQTFADYFQLSSGDSVLQQSSFSFDTSIEEVFPILSVGGRLVIAEARNDIPMIIDEMKRERITVLSTNPYVLQFLDNDKKIADMENLRVLISGGDVLKPGYISNIAGNVDIYNTYGPTESTVCATYYKINHTPETAIPIGRPITNRSIYIIDDFNNLQPVGAVGEICIAGAGLALQYLNLPGETETAFTRIPVCKEKVYRTGDLGRWLPDGNIVFEGRKDRQLSVNGHRVEPREIEHCITAIDGVEDCMVDTIEQNGHKLLVAYITTGGRNIEQALIRETISTNLPPAMMPSAIMILEAFPLLPGGKIDRSQLPAPGISEETIPFEAAANALEEKLVAIWKRLLNREEIGRNNNFFELGGHSLLANQFVSIVRDECKAELSLKTFYRNPSIQSLAQIIESSIAAKQELISIPRAPVDARIPLSYAQERLWFLNQLDKDNAAYNVPRALKLSGDVRLDLLEQTFTTLVERHEILRTVFRTEEGVPFQVVLPPYHFHIPVIDYSTISPDRQEALVNKFILDEGNQPFDLANGPLLKVSVHQLSATESIMVVCEHHLIHDGWTQGVLLNEFIQLYSSFVTGELSPLAPLTIQYGDFAYWQKHYYNEHRLKENLSYWTQKLKGVSPGLNLPIYKPRPAINAGKGDMETVHISTELYNKLTAFCKKYDVTAFMTMLAVFKLLLHKYSNDLDICVGTGVANRRIKELDNMLGMIINTIALRTEISPGEDFVTLVNTVKTVCLEGYENEDAPFGEVVVAVNPVRTLNSHPLVQYMFSFMNTPTTHVELPGLNIEVKESYNHSAKFDICIVVVMPLEDRNVGAAHEENPEIILEWEYNSEIFDRDTMKDMLAAYTRLLTRVLDNPDKKIELVNVLSHEERDEIIAFSHQSYPAGKEKTIDGRFKTLTDLFEEQARQTPGNTALVYEKTSLTYKELDEASGRLAAYLRDNYTIDRDDLIGIKLDRSEWLIIAILAILKAGAGYVPIDIEYPAERIDFMVKDSHCKLVIDEAELGKFKKGKAKYITHPTGSGNKPEDLAYVIYTSGSTGKPKGVMIEHSSVVNLVLSQVNTFGIQADENILQLSNIAFDASVEQIFIALASGACLTLAGKETMLDPGKLEQFISDNGITHIHTVPGVLKTIPAKKYPCLKRVIAGGDRCAPSLAQSWSPYHAFYNEYGPTETTITSIELLYDEQVQTMASLPIGRPVHNTTVYIMSNEQALSPIGVAGEICIGGAGVARGYLNKPNLTTEKFIPDPFMKGGRIYRTGDIGRWLPDGTIEFIGRRDDQVKIRGYRIELGEIENALHQFSAIKSAVVIAKPNADGENELVAYLVLKELLVIADIRSLLGAVLPTYMIPAHFVLLESIPVTQSGKTDRKKLPDHIEVGMKTGTAYVAPRNETEEKLVLLWQEVLGKEEIGVKDNFFELGGHSLKATRIIAKIHDRFGIKIDVRDLFIEPTIEYLANYIDTITWLDNKMEMADPAGTEIII